jgi:hypothetical protein
MATKKTQQAVAAIIPVSQEANIEMDVFEAPTGQVLGSVLAFDTVNGKWIRCANCRLMADGPEITLDALKGRPTVAEVERFLSIQSLFVEKVKEFYAGR